VWYVGYGQPVSEFRLPQKKAEREALVVEIGWDGLALLEHIYLGTDTPVEVRHVSAGTHQ
jgi:hypothetical protein